MASGGDRRSDAPSTDGRLASAEALRPWQRFHFRLTLLYGGLMLLLLTAMAAFFSAPAGA